MIEQGILTTSFAQMGESVSVDNDEILFSIKFSSKSNLLLSEFISLTSQFTAAESYDDDFKVGDVNLVFSDGDLSISSTGKFELFQNSPNPFLSLIHISEPTRPY